MSKKKDKSLSAILVKELQITAQIIKNLQNK